MSTAQNLTPLTRNESEQPDRLINVHEAAILAHKAEVTIYNAASPKVGKLHPIRGERGHLLFSEKEVKMMYGNSPVDRRKAPSGYEAPIIKPNNPNDFNSVILREADSLLGQISVMETSLASLKKKYSLLEPLILELRR